MEEFKEKLNKFENVNHKKYVDGGKFEGQISI